MGAEFFDYPTDDAGGPGGDLTFMERHFEEDWTIVLGHTEARRFSAGEVVIRAGEVDRALYLVTAGSLEVAGSGHFRSIEAPAVVGGRTSTSKPTRRRSATASSWSTTRAAPWARSCSGTPSSHPR